MHLTYSDRPCIIRSCPSVFPPQMETVSAHLSFSADADALTLVPIEVLHIVQAPL